MIVRRHPRVAVRDNAAGVAGGEPSKYQAEFKLLAWTNPRLRGDDATMQDRWPASWGGA